MTDKRFPPGWDEERARHILAHYEPQSDEEAAAEDEAAFKGKVAGLVDHRSGRRGEAFLESCFNYCILVAQASGD
jgi:plasmid stabilization system protein ParE